jgi:TetR/AcrR family transcriptional regulator, transcriptional repressor for nem operon
LRTRRHAGTSRTQPNDPTTATRILDEAERLAQTRGFNGLSYADVAAVVGTSKAALHYHFATKADLGRALIERYTDRFFAALGDIEASGAAAPERLQRYARLYADVLKQDRLCLCGMLAAEYTTLPEPMRSALREFFGRNEAWLSDLLEAGRAAGTLHFDGPPRDSARALMAVLEGAMLLARAYGDTKHFDAAAAYLIRDVTSAA